jgi:hypothetical protein
LATPLKSLVHNINIKKMRARQRHLNARAAGASLVLDARYIPQQADFSFVTTWADRSGNGYDMTQGSTTWAPYYRSRSMNGLPSALYDGTNDYLQTSAALDYTGFISVVRCSATSGNRGLIGAFASNGLPDGAYYIGFNGANRSSGFTRVSSTRQFGLAAGAGDLALNTPAIFSASRSNSEIKAAINGVYGAQVTFSITPSTVIGPSLLGATAYSTSTRTDYYLGDIAIMIGIQGSRPSDSIMKRLNHFAGYSYKIACS